MEDLFGTGAAQGGFSIFGSPPPAGYGVEELQKLYVDAILDQISDGTIDVADVNLEVLKSIGATEDQIAAAGANTTTAENSQDINRSDVGPLSEEEQIGQRLERILDRRGDPVTKIVGSRLQTPFAGS